MAVLPFAALTLLVDSSTASATTGAYTMSRRLVDFTDVQYARISYSGSVTTPTGVGAYLQVRITYSADGGVTYGIDLGPITPQIGDTQTYGVSPWVEIAVHDELWIRAELVASAGSGTGLSHTLKSLDVQYR